MGFVAGNGKDRLGDPNEKLLGIMRVLNPATRKDLAARTWSCSGTNPK